jgi:hypothetical protein
MELVQGTGLVDVFANRVSTDELLTTSIQTDSGDISMNGARLTDVETINGHDLDVFDSRITQNTNRSVFSSNLGVTSSNVLFPRAAFGSNTAVFSSNLGVASSNVLFPMAAFGSNAAVFSSNLAVASSNALYPMAAFASNVAVFGSNVAVGARDKSEWTSNVWNANLRASAGMLSNLQTTLATSNLSCRQLQSRGANLFDPNNKIDYNTWISGGPVFSNDNSLAVAGLTLGAAGLVSSLGAAGTLISQNGNLGASVLEDIGRKMGEQALDESYDPTTDGSNINVHWNSLLFVPFHKNRGSQNVIGISSNVLLSSNGCKIYSTPASDLTLVDGGRYRRIAANPSMGLLIDVGARQYFGNDFFAASNMNSLNSTCTNGFVAGLSVSSNISAAALTVGGRAVASEVRVGSFYVRPDGIWLGDPVADPFGSQLIISGTGRVQRAMLDGESLSLERLGDGVMEIPRAATNSAAGVFDAFAEFGPPLISM